MTTKDLLADALPIIKEFAPTLAGAIGGPIAAAAAYVIPLLAQAFSSPPNDLKKLTNNILQDASTPDKLKCLEEDHSNIINALLDSLNSVAKAEITIKLERKPDHN